MSYASKLLNARGLSCSIARTPIVTSKVSMKRSSKSTANIGIRDAAWEGLILADAGLASGEVFTVNTNKYLVQSVDNDPASGEDIFFCTRTNANLMHKRFVETVDANNNVVQAWQVQVSSVPSFIQVVTSQLRQFDPGLLEQTKYLAQASCLVSAAILEDRMIYNSKNLMVVSIDDAMSGIYKLQLGTDVRPD